MKIVWGVTLLAGNLGLATIAFSEQLVQPSNGTQIAQAVCEQVISCGTKNGVRKEYPTPCAARDDGATNVTPKTDPTCEAASK